MMRFENDQICPYDFLVSQRNHTSIYTSQRNHISIYKLQRNQIHSTPLKISGTLNNLNNQAWTN